MWPSIHATVYEPSPRSVWRSGWLWPWARRGGCRRGELARGPISPLQQHASHRALVTIHAGSLGRLSWHVARSCCTLWTRRLRRRTQTCRPNWSAQEACVSSPWRPWPPRPSDGRCGKGSLPAFLRPQKPLPGYHSGSLHLIKTFLKVLGVISPPPFETSSLQMYSSTRLPRRSEALVPKWSAISAITVWKAIAFACSQGGSSPVRVLSGAKKTRAIVQGKASGRARLRSKLAVTSLGQKTIQGRSASRPW